ncbi:hypothetical protein [Streptomyces sp. NPDC058759]|uniref:hypothetical protein n=1 Tax=Streptomyces sp. NPDC058759 TaxID=3346628 RepID=UPI0036C55D5F
MSRVLPLAATSGRTRVRVPAGSSFTLIAYEWLLPVPVAVLAGRIGSVRALTA